MSRAWGPWTLTWRDRQGEEHEGHVYRSSNGVFYFYGPTEENWTPKWQMELEARNLLRLCQDYLTQEAQVEIAELAGIQWE